MEKVANMDVDALKSFIDDNEDLEQLETILYRFNLFESLGLVRQEIRHSAFLRWLLDPTETHGLSDYWLRQFLRKVIKNGEEILGNTFSLFDLDGWDLTQAEVRREWRNIDILILDEKNHFVCAIENKVDSGESGDQLKRYQQLVEQEFAQYKKAFVFLTKFGNSPSEDSYIPFTYKDLVFVIENALGRRESQLNYEIKLFVQHYLDMVRRHIVEDSDLQELCRKLYKNHHRALDLIFEHRHDRIAEVGKLIQEYITSRSDDLIPINDSTTYIKFLPKSMNIRQIQHEGKPVLAWQLANKGKQVQFDLQIRRGPEAMREKIYEQAKAHPEIFGNAKSSLSKEFHTLFSETWITNDEYYELDDGELKQKIYEGIRDLLESKGEGITNALRELT